MIRDANPADIDYILLLEQENFNRPWSRTSFENEFEKQNSEFLVYELNGHVAGYIIFWYIFNEGEIGIVSVSEKHRRKGIAAELIKTCIFKHPEVSSIFLEVDQTNTGAICLYKRLGFSETGTKKDYYGKGKDALCMCMGVK